MSNNTISKLLMKVYNAIPEGEDRAITAEEICKRVGIDAVDVFAVPAIVRQLKRKGFIVAETVPGTGCYYIPATRLEKNTYILTLYKDMRELQQEIDTAIERYGICDLTDENGNPEV